VEAVGSENSRGCSLPTAPQLMPLEAPRLPPENFLDPFFLNLHVATRRIAQIR
jgi:hypothetical protein